jgi:hypothetical protein
MSQIRLATLGLRRFRAFQDGEDVAEPIASGQVCGRRVTVEGGLSLGGSAQAFDFVVDASHKIFGHG